MKRLVVIMLCMAAFHAQAQEETGVIKTNPLGWFVGQFQFGYEHFLSENVSVQLIPGGIFHAGSVSINDSIVGFFETYSATRTGFIVIPEFRYYLGDVAPDGLYIAPFARYRSVTTKVDEDDQSSEKRNAMGGGFVLGYQYQLANGLTGEVFLGPQLKSVNTTPTGAYEQYDEDVFDDVQGSSIRFGITIGFVI